jgi:UDP:flavonoid glycosyltransferase YjiC (YdhE family)
MATNGGYGGVLTALSTGVPLVGAGLTEDKVMVNARIAWSGVGIDLKTNTPTEEMIWEAVRKVLDDGRYGRKAREIQADFEKYPGPKNACDALEELVRSL